MTGNTIYGSISEELAADLSEDEGFVPTAYQDSLGYWTIGSGILIDSRVPGAGITREEDAMLKSNRVKKLIQELHSAYPKFVTLDRARQLVLANMAYNLGVPRLMGFKKTLAAVSRGDYLEASKEMLDSRWARQVKGRAVRLAEQMRTGKTRREIQFE